MKVLIVDSDWRFSSRAEEYLESRAHLVVRVAEAQQALRRAEHWKVDLVIVAAEMADSGILEALSRLEPRPAILLTGWMDRYDIAWRAWQRGGDELLMKPVFRTAELHLAVVMAMENAAAGTRGGRVPAAASA